MDFLFGGAAVGAIPLARAGCGQQRMRVRFDGDVDGQRITPGDPGRWMQQDRVTDRIAFRVQRFLHPERAEVFAPSQHGARTALLKAQRKSRAPAKRSRCVLGSAHCGVRHAVSLLVSLQGLGVRPHPKA